MSSRQLRKLQKQRELQELQEQNAANDDESSDDNNDRPAQKPKPSLFSGFAALGDRDDQDSDADEEKEDEVVKAPVKPVTKPDQIETPKSSSKKSKKKKKKQNKQEIIHEKTKSVSKNGPDEIDQALRELNLSKEAGQEIRDDGPDIKHYERICELLSTNTYHLRVLNEMRNLFGREAIEMAESEEAQEQARSRRQRQGLPQHVDLETFLKGLPGKPLPEVTLRRNPFLSGKDTWPRAPTEGLTMEQLKEEGGGIDSKSGINEFRFVHDDKYNNLEAMFFSLVQMYDPMRIVHFLHNHPYHISSLIQVSRIAKQDQNSALSADLCERALFTFGRVSLSAFRQKVEQGKARLSFLRPENRQFWLAGYHYLKNLIMKGTYRTALEWAKLLFSLDPSDPYGMIHFIHPLAIRAHESEWFIDVCNSPILQDLEEASRGVPDYIKQTLVLAKLQQNDIAGAKILLAKGIERLPWLYSNLFKALNLDVPKAIWGLQSRNQDEELYTAVYVHQTKKLWENAQAMALLKETASEATRPDVNKTYSPPPIARDNIARFVFLLEVTSLIGLVPRDLLNVEVNWEFDPLPPARDQNIFSYESQKRPWGSTQLQDNSEFGPALALGRHDFRRLLQRARREGAPMAVQQDLEQAMQEAFGAEAGVGSDDDNDNDDASDGSEDREDATEAEPAPGRMDAIFRAVLGLLNPHGYGDARGDFEGMGGIPGEWQDSDVEDDDVLPPLIPANENDTNNAGNGRNDPDDTDDEIPDLERV
ncbi:hypothetical protein M426DRAFT_321645 [Hypoxylon sp. CI-4A]|nr:hypothetical protein M426DRAFT_321645 [Hypoxylon sp. CI-4A]